MNSTHLARPIAKTSIRGLLLLAATTVLASASHAQSIINLTQDAAVRAAGATYTYYARGDASAVAITPFATKFYPGNPLHTTVSNPQLKDTGPEGVYLTDAGSDSALPVAFTTGVLTNNSNTAKVGGWVNIEELFSGVATSNHPGSFDIVFDLKSTYVITSITVTYSDASGARWFTDTVNGATDAQKFYTSLTVPTSDAGTTLFGSATALSGATPGTTGTMLVSASESVSAQYVIFRPVVIVGASPNSGSGGGWIHEITINGYSAIPEPSTWATIAGGFALLGALSSRRRNRN